MFEDAEGMEAYRLSAPYMKDAAGSISRGLTLTLTDDGGKKNKEAYVTLEADSEWLGAEDRVYPVTIDPVVSTPLAYDKIEDCHVSSYYHTDNFYESYMLKTGRVDGSTLRSYMKFQLPAISRADHMVTSASFFLTKYEGSGSAARRIDVHKVIQPWFHRSLTWDNRPDYDVRISDYAVFSTDKADQKSFDITDMVKDWYKNGRNYGLMIKDHEETGNYTEYASADIHKDFAELRPHILIQYVGYAGLEDYWTYHSQSVGRAGTVHVNDASGNMIMVHDTFSLSGSRMPIDLKHVYNSSEYEEDMGYGKGFRLNYHQTIESTTINKVTYYKHIDGDGTSRYFVKNDKGEWKDELGMELTLEVKDIQEGAKYIITDKNNTQMIFGASGRLAKITDANGNTLTIVYAGDPKKLDTVADGSGRKIKCSYDANGRLASVKAPSGQEKTFTYDSDGRLTKITDVDGVSSTYTYHDKYHMMTKISDHSGYNLSCTYERPNANTAWRVTKLLEKAGTTEGMSLSMAYSYNCTRFTDEKGRSQYYLFDNSGHTVSVRDDNGYGAAWKYQSGKASRLSAASDLQFTPIQMLKGNFGGLTGWRHYTSADTVTVSEDTSVHYIGKKCIKMNGTGTDAYGTVVQNVSLKPGKRYVFSVYAKAEPTAVAAKSAVWLQAWKVDDTEIVRHIHPVKGKMDWTRIQMSFTAPAAEEGADSVTVKVYARSMYMKGNLWLDAFQLEEGEAASRFNLLVNNNFANGLYGFKKAGGAGDEDSVITVTGNGQDIRLAATITKSGSALYRYADSSGNKLMDLPVNTKAFVLGAGYDKAGTRYYLLNGTKDGKTFEGYTQMGNVSLSGRGAYAVVKARAADGSLNVRTGPGTSYTSLVQISEGTSLIITGAGKDSSGKKWYLCSFTKSGKDYTGYIAAEYVTVTYYANSEGKAKAAASVKKGPGSSYAQTIALAADAAFTVSGETVLADGTRWLYISGTKGTTEYKGHLPASSVTITKKGDIKYVYVPPQTWRPASGSTLGDQVLRINGNEKDNKELVYTLDISGKKGDCYMASAWGQGKGVSLLGSDRKDRHFGICVAFTCTDGTVERHHVDFGADTERWQYLNEAVVAKQDYSKIQVMYCYHKNGYRSHFTGLSLFKEQYGTSFAYDEKGNVVKATDKAKKNNSFEYDSSNNMKKLIDAKGNAFQYDYDGKHNVKGATSAAKMRYTFGYDSYGNPTMARTADPAAETDAKKAITSKATYTTGTAAGQYMATQTAPEGTKSSYDWDMTKGLLKSVSTGGRQTAYTYDTAGRLTKVSGKAHVGGAETQIQVQYGYEKDRLAKITHNGFDYVFTYDGFGNRKSVKIAGKEAISHTYGDKNGLLLKSIYANGWEVSYTYDNMDRVTQVKAAKGSSSYVIGKYLYDRQGRVARFIDGQVSRKSCTYGYDLTDRLCEAVFDDGTAYRYTYDANDCLVKEEQTTPDGIRTVTRVYDADSRETSVTCSTAKIEKTFDKLGRLSSIKRNGGKHTTTYTYETASDGGQTGRVKTVKNGSSSENYTYDTWGNVTKVTENSSQSGKTYAYDAQGQLIREYDPDKKLWFGYKYDAGGNMTEVRSYPAAENGDPEGEGTVIKKFTYGRAWKDQLTAMTVDGTTRNFTYDANGNLLSDGKYTYSWTKGSMLAKVTGDGLEATYTYDASGIRTSKTVNGVKTEYLTAGSSVLSEKKNGKWQHYLYEGSGQLMAIRYKGADYYYIRDGLMCITGLVDANGTAVVNYKYDSWGKLISITGSMADTLGKDNPYRYKGYYYDEETGMYYLKSRYYQPEICRFISADVYIATELNMNGSNMYSYCKNNPVMLMDSDGDFAILAVAGAFLAKKGTEMFVGAVVNVATTAITAGILGEEYTLKDAIMAAVTGAVGALDWKAQVGLAVTSGVYNLGVAAIKGEDIDTALATTAISVAGSLGSTGSISSMLKTNISIGTSAVIGMTCDLGVNLSTSAATKAVNNSSHTSRKPRKKSTSIQAYVIRTAIRVAVRQALMSRSRTSNRRKRGWIDLEGIRKRRTYN